MAGAPVKFRCYRCNQLLGISRAKIGAIVSCPKCLAELVVPDPSEVPSASVNAPTTTVTAAGERSLASGTLDAGLSFDLLDLRPEDIRVEPGVARFAPRPADNGPHAPPVPEEPEFRTRTDTVLEPQPEDDAGTQATAEPAPEPAPIVNPPEPQTLPPAPRPPTMISPAGIETVDSGPIRPPSVRARDVVLPRSVVAAWSLFVLVAQALSFLAGLLAGHFVWRVH